jgi:hypothetical protein
VLIVFHAKDVVVIIIKKKIDLGTPMNVTLIGWLLVTFPRQTTEPFLSIFANQSRPFHQSLPDTARPIPRNKYHTICDVVFEYQHVHNRFGVNKTNDIGVVKVTKTLKGFYQPAEHLFQAFGVQTPLMERFQNA